MEKEIWKDVKEYEGLYQISNFGRIKSTQRTKRFNLNPEITYIKKEKILKTQVNRYGYEFLRAKKDGAKRSFTIHRKVALAFIPNPENKPFVNHINGIKTDNRVENLEWVTASENINHAIKTKLKKFKKGKEHHNYKIVIQYGKNGEFIRKWAGFHEINRELGYDCRNIYACANRVQHTAYGFVWRYENDNFDKTENLNKKPNSKQKVKCLTNGIEYESISQAAKDTGASSGGILGVCKGFRKHANGMVFEYA